MLVVGQRHEGVHRSGMPAIEGVPPGRSRVPFQEPPQTEPSNRRRGWLAVGRRRHRRGGRLACPVEAPPSPRRCWWRRSRRRRRPLAAANDVLALGVAAIAYTSASMVSRSVPSTWYSRTAHPSDSSSSKMPTAKRTPSGSAATQPRRTLLPHRGVAVEGAHESTAERPQLRGAVERAADEARSARQHHHRRDRVLCAPGCALARAVAPHLDLAVRARDEAASTAAAPHALHRMRVLVYATTATNGLLRLPVPAVAASTAQVRFERTRLARLSCVSTRPRTSTARAASAPPHFERDEATAKRHLRRRRRREFTSTTRARAALASAGSLRRRHRRFPARRRSRQPAMTEAGSGATPLSCLSPPQTVTADAAASSAGECAEALADGGASLCCTASALAAPRPSSQRCAAPR